MKILVAGGHGQLGRALAARGALALSHAELDVTNSAQVAGVLAAHAPDVVIDAAGYTAVDKAEAERPLAFAVNAEGAKSLATTCAQIGARLIYVSTDYVFDGTATSPIAEVAATAPLGVYGESKRAGELSVLAHGGTVVRTSWLFGEGGPSFVHAIVRRAREQVVLKVVADQHGCPTYTGHLAAGLLAVAQHRELGGETLNVCDGPATTWHAFAEAVVAEARTHVTLACERIVAITTAAYPTAARRPAYSVLDPAKARSLGLPLGDWRAGLRTMLATDLRKCAVQ